MHQELIISGFGGQGIMFAGQLLTHAGMIEKRYVSWIPSYGPEMRGGTANCSVVISESEISSPIVTEPTILIAFNLPSLDKFEENVIEGGQVFFNSSLIKRKPMREDSNFYGIPANKIADRIGSSRVVNMVILGALIEKTQLVSLKTVYSSLKYILPENRHGLISLNKTALNEGMRYLRNNYNEFKFQKGI